VLRAVRTPSLRWSKLGSAFLRHTSPVKRAVRVGLILVSLFLGALAVWRLAIPRSTGREYPVTGVVLAVEDNDAVLVAHREIAGFMPAMTMPFTFANARDRERLSPGDVVQFTFRIDDRRSESMNVTVIGRDPATVAAYASATARKSARLRAGDPVPAFSLVDQDGTPLSDGDLAGRPTVVTFIFTRCPVPEYCPAIAGRFREVQRALAKDGSFADVRLLSVTLDPQHDTPAVLRDYGRAIGADFGRWRFATGTPEQVSGLTRAFPVYAQASGGTIDHTLATALIDARGRVVEIWRGHLWATKDVLDALSALRRAG
jgi:protein SCO1/2